MTSQTQAENVLIGRLVHRVQRLAKRRKKAESRKVYQRVGIRLRRLM